MEPRISMITLGVADMQRAYAFYHDGLGFPTPHKAPQKPDEGVIFFQTRGTCLAIYPKDKLAEDVRPGSREISDAFTGITLAHNVRRREQVEEVLQLAERAGGKIVKHAQEPPWGGLSGYFADPDGYAWEVAWHSDWRFNDDGSLVIK
jgi:catechol 2,3-dioxygenase-like lactoylglutathione lyase family enzyme